MQCSAAFRGFEPWRRRWGRKMSFSSLSSFVDGDKKEVVEVVGRVVFDGVVDTPWCFEDEYRQHE